MNILVTAPYEERYLEKLKKDFGEVFYYPWKKQGRPNESEELLNLINKHDVDGLITELDNVDEKVINHVPKLSFIGVCRANPVNVDISAANSKKIPVFHTPARNAQSVTELLIANLITFLRNIISSNNWITNNNWTETNERPYVKFKGSELAGKKVGFVGFGAVGQKVANILKNFPCDIQFYDPYVEKIEENFNKTSLQNIFTTSDVISIHLPVKEETKKLVDFKLINSMKQDAIFINTSRAAVIDSQALYNALYKNKIRGAILDVFENEPPSIKDQELINLDNVLATPHIAGASIEVESHHSSIMYNNLKAFYNRNEYLNVFNKKHI